MSAGKKFSMLVRIAVHGVIQEIGANGAIVEEGVAFPGGPVAGDLLVEADLIGPGGSQRRIKEALLLMRGVTWVRTPLLTGPVRIGVLTHRTTAPSILH